VKNKLWQMQGAQISKLARSVLMDLPEKPPCIDVAEFDAIEAIATNWTTAGTNQVLRQVAAVYESGVGVDTTPFMDHDSLALLWALKVR
jgi:hypothetical protein